MIKLALSETLTRIRTSLGLRLKFKTLFMSDETNNDELRIRGLILVDVRFDHVTQTVHHVILYAPLIGCVIEPQSIACDQYTLILLVVIAS